MLAWIALPRGSSATASKQLISYNEPLDLHNGAAAPHAGNQVMITGSEEASSHACCTVLPLKGGGPHTMTARTGKTTPEAAVARQQVAERITVALIPKVGEDLQRLQDRTSLSKTDIANRAITLYEFIDAQLRAGRDVLIRDNDTGETQTVRLL
jgi:hypothetical protein